MKKLLEYLFGVSIVSLQKESGDAVQVFKDTLTKLAKANDKANEQISKREEQISLLAKENVTLGEIVVGNSKLINKITEFLT